MSEPSRLQQDSQRLSPRGLFLAILLAMIPWAILVWRFDWLCDDAFISFRFAKNLAAGHGLRFNLGSHPPVEGFSNFLWNVWMALFEFLRLDVTVWSRVTSILCSGALLVYVTRFAQRTFNLGFLETLFTALFFGTLPTIAIWSTGGLESMTACLLLFLVYERLLGDPERPHGFQAGVLAIIYTLTREEAPGFIAVLLGLAVLTWLITRKKALLKAALTVLVLLAIALTIHFTWRYAYYGDFISNTARLKAGFYWLRIERGANYIVMLFITVPSCLAVLLFPFCRRPSPTSFSGCRRG
jgi:arabinofuranosyltransferase